MTNLRILSDDRKAIYLANYAHENNKEVEIYVQHLRSEAVQVRFLTFGEEADEVHIQEMEEEVDVGDQHVNEHEEEVQMVDKEPYGVEKQEEVNVDIEEVEMDEEEPYGGEEHEDVNVDV